MKHATLILCILVIGLALAGCQTGSGPEPTAAPETPQLTRDATATPAATTAPTATATAEATATPTWTPTPSLEELYGIPDGWQLVLKVLPDTSPWGGQAVANTLIFALPPEWTCHENPDDAPNIRICILDELPDDLNQRNTRLRADFSWWQDRPTISQIIADYEEGRAFYGYTCESSPFTVDDFEAVAIACTNPEYDDTIDYDTDREAFGEANSRQIPEYFVLIINGYRVEQFHFRTWDKSQMPSLFEELTPYIHYADR